MRSRVVALLMVAAIVAAGCASDGRALREPSADQTTTTRPPPPTSALPQEISPSGLALSSPDFDPGGQAPVDTTCSGANQYPTLVWAGVGTGTVEIAVTLTDHTDPEQPLLLWLMAGIPASTTTIEAGVPPAGSFESLNDYGRLGYGDPCIETLGGGGRDLQFRIYLLEQPSGLAGGDPGNQAWASLRAQATDSATLLMRT